MTTRFTRLSTKQCACVNSRLHSYYGFLLECRSGKNKLSNVRSFIIVLGRGLNFLQEKSLCPLFGQKKSTEKNGHKSTSGPHRKDVTHILRKVSRFLKLKSFHIRKLQKRQVFPHTNPYISNVTQQCRCSYFELGLPVVSRGS